MDFVTNGITISIERAYYCFLPAENRRSNIGWDDKPRQDTRLYCFDEVKKISEAQEG